MINFDAVDFSERRSEEVISFFWRSVYIEASTWRHDGGQTIATEINVHLCKHLFTLLCIKVFSWTPSFVVQAHWLLRVPMVHMTALDIQVSLHNQMASFSGLSSNTAAYGNPLYTYSHHNPRQKPCLNQDLHKHFATCESSYAEHEIRVGKAMETKALPHRIKIMILICIDSHELKETSRHFSYFL